MSEDTAILRDILSTLREIRDSLRSGGASANAGDSAPSGKGGKVAGDRELDSEWGNPVVRGDPRKWDGPSYKSCRLSECPPEYLDQLADLFDWMADMDERDGKMTPAKNGKPGKPTAPYKRSDAGRARGWAARIRAGWKPPPPSAGDVASDDFGGMGSGADEIPFTFCDAAHIGERWWRNT